MRPKRIFQLGFQIAAREIALGVKDCRRQESVAGLWKMNQT